MFFLVIVFTTNQTVPKQHSFNDKSIKSIMKSLCPINRQWLLWYWQSLGLLSHNVLDKGKLYVYYLTHFSFVATSPEISNLLKQKIQTLCNWAFLGLGFTS